MLITSVLLLFLPSLHLVTIWEDAKVQFRASDGCSNQVVVHIIFGCKKLYLLFSGTAMR